MFGRLRRWWNARRAARREALAFEREIVVAFDDGAIEVRVPARDALRVAWADIRSVAIATNDGGPFVTDVWWCIEGDEGGVLYPLGATGEAELLAQLQARLPGFDNQAVVAAMGSTANARFVCWQRA